MFRNSSHVPNHDSTGILVRARKIAQTGKVISRTKADKNGESQK